MMASYSGGTRASISSVNLAAWSLTSLRFRFKFALRLCQEPNTQRRVSVGCIRGGTQRSCGKTQAAQIALSIRPDFLHRLRDPRYRYHRAVLFIRFTGDLLARRIGGDLLDSVRTSYVRAWDDLPGRGWPL